MATKKAPATKKDAPKTALKKSVSAKDKPASKTIATKKIKETEPASKSKVIEKSKVKTAQSASKHESSNKKMSTAVTKKAAKKGVETVKETKAVKKAPEVKVSKNIKLKNDPTAILKAIPKEELKPFTRSDKQNFGVKEKLQALYYMQQLDSRVDEIRIIRGELPMEVQDLQDEVEGINARIENIHEEINNQQEAIMKKKQAVKDANAQIKKYESQQMNVKNNREYDSLSKEIEYQQLDIQLSEKRVKEYTYDLNIKNQELEDLKTSHAERSQVLEQKKNELDIIIGETQKEEVRMMDESEKASKLIDANLLTAYKRVRKSMINGLAVVKIHRDACGGCFNKIPPQMQLEIGQRKKVTFCEHCGRILVDTNINDW